jgi:hypothetical protein
MHRITPKVGFIALVILISSLACSLVTDTISDSVQEPPAVNEPAPTTEQADTVVETPTPETATSTEQSDQPQEQVQAEPAPESVDQPVGDGLVPPPLNNDACTNTFYPLIPGYQWVYEVTSEGETSQFGLTVSKIDGNQATLHALYLDTGVTTEVIVDCQDGTIVNFPILLLGFLFGDVDGEMNLEHKSGVFMPNYETFAANNWDHTWTSQYTAFGEVDAVVDGDQVTGKLEQSPLDMEWNALGAGEAIFEGVTVEAGNFPRAVKFQREAKLDFTAEFIEEGQQVSLSAVLIMNTNLWYEPNMGLLKQEIERASAKIYGVSFPITMNGTIELVEFRTSD